MPLFTEIVAAAAEAQSVLGQLTGSPAPDRPNFTGPDGRAYLGVFRAANAFEAARLGSEMQAHGFTDAAVLVLTATRTQFTTPPLAWRRQYLQRTSPAARCLIHSVAVDDPLHFIFVLSTRQGAA